MDTNAPSGGTPLSRNIWLWTGGAAVTGALAAFLVMPTAPDMDAESGDSDLAAEVADLLPENSAVGVSVALIDGDEVTRATVGTTDGSTPADVDTAFETGSVQKVLTGTLLADMVRTNDVRLDTTLEEIWSDVDFADDNVAGITLEQLATHHAGLPSVHNDVRNSAAVSVHNLLGTDPYRGMSDPIEAVAGLTNAGPDDDTESVYSNLGFALLGQSLAEAAGEDYPELVTERVLEPLGMSDTVLLTSAKTPPDGARPHRNPTIPVQPSFNPPYTPAGLGTWSTSGDMVTLLRAGITEDHPALVAAQEPRTEPESDARHEQRTGLGWAHWNIEDTTIVWHNGGTAGSRSFIAHTEDGRGVVVLSNSARVPAETIGLRLLDPDMPEIPNSTGVPFLATPIAYLFAAAFPFMVLLRTARQKVTSWTPRLDRVGLVSSLTVGVCLWAVSFQTGDTDMVRPLWALGAGGLAAATAMGVWRWAGLPVTRAPRAWSRWTDFALNMAIAIPLLAGMLWVVLG